MEHVEIDGLRVAFRRRGQGPPLLLLHGGVTDGRTWRIQLDDLSDDFTVVAWDAPGCGGSSDPPETFRLPDYADCLARFVDALGMGRPHVLGHSWGSGLALELFRRHATVPSTLLLAGAYAGWAGSLPAEEVEARLGLTLQVADRLPDGFDPGSVPGLFSAALPEERAAEMAAVMAEIRPTGTRVMAHSFAEADLRDVLGRIDVPTLLLYGDADERSPLDVARALHDAIPTSSLVVLPGLGHMAHLEAPEAFDAEVRRFLAGLPS
ncbi:MAG: alpha/beta hydrolase [Acidimicrobiia bacterium]|nr:alpha/beta hydrolase [Acidimicrobiia bacterium]